MKSLVWYLPLAILAGVFLWGVTGNTSAELGPIPHRNHTEGVYQILVFVWSLIFGFLLNSGFTRHCSGQLDLNLPLPARRLWLNHNLAIVISGLSIMLVTLAVIFLANWLQGTRPLVRPGLVSFAIHLSAGMMLVVALLQSPKPGLWSIPLNRQYVLFCIATFLGYLGLTVVLSALPPVFALVPLGLALLLSLRTYRSLPASFVTAPVQVARAGPISGGQTVLTSDERDPAPGWFARFWLLHGSIWRSTLGQWTWFYIPNFLFYGVILADFDRGPHILFYPLAWIMLLSWTIVFLRGMPRVHPWPVSRRRIFNILVAAALLPLIGGFWLGTVGRTLWGESPRGVDFRTVSCCGVLTVPYEKWKISWHGQAPTCTAPWGETAEPRQFPLARGDDPVLYKPYPIAPESSLDFTAWQISRAVAEVHGFQLSYQVIRDRYLQTGPDGTVLIQQGGFTLLQDYGLSPTLWSVRAFPVIMTVICLPWLLMAALVFRLHRGDVDPIRARWIGSVLFGPAIVIAMGILAVSAWGWLDLWAVSRVCGILLDRLGEIVPGGAFTIWGGCLLLLAGGYRLALQRFQVMEIPLHTGHGFGK